MHSHDRTLLSRLGFADPDKKDSRHDLACQYLAQSEIALRLVDLVTAREPGRQAWAVLKADPEHHITKGEGQYKTTIGFADLCIRFTVLIDEKDYPLQRQRESGVQEVAMKWAQQQRSELDTRHRRELEPYEDDWHKEAGWAPGGPAHRAYKAKMAEQETEKAQSEEQITKHLAKEKERLLQTPARWEPKQAGSWHDAVTTGGYYSGASELLVEVKINPVSTGDILRQLGLYRTYLEPKRTLLATAFDLSVEDVAMLQGERVHHIRLGAAFDTYCLRRKEQPQMAAAVEV